MVNERAIFFWFVGALCVFFGALIAGNVEANVLGANVWSIAFAYIISFVLILLGGMFWISTSLFHLEE
jgi:hypothetical protein